eukprot:TRINITY_DN3316_c0_g1_i1.p1 TRINITY_DN3316_c0_g1~~TRINITY_DN3316_c0_g1_i1.p1  ORF type:complete len:413 (-),score=86.01 TRINITY_DN3316_c0_g1_i1:29-1267(-)
MAPLVFFLTLLVWSAHSLDNGMARTPFMGYNPWNQFNCHISDAIVRSQADAMVSLGLASHGYVYVGVDDCWQVSRDASGVIVADPEAFPHGMKALADYIHSIGLKFSIYSSAGNLTCKGRPSSLGYEKQDAKTYVEWGVDLVKYDECHPPLLPPAKQRFIAMRDALNATGRHMIYSMSAASDVAALWATPVANSWRTTMDERDTWTETLINMDLNNLFSHVAGPGGWNDADMMEIGNGGLTHSEEIVHMSVWALIKSPLLIGCDLNNVSSESVALYMNSDVLAVSQDKLGKQGVRVWSSLFGEKHLHGAHSRHQQFTSMAKQVGAVPAGNVEVWAGELEGGDYAVILFNRGMKSATTVTAPFTLWGWTSKTVAKARDLWTHTDLGAFIGTYSSIGLAPHSIQMIRFSILSTK